MAVQTARPNEPQASPAPERALQVVEPQLATLAQCINEEHAAVGAATAKAGEHAYRAGELLLKVKAELKHKQFTPWLEENFAGSVRTAQAYMRVADKLPNAQSAAGLSIDSALKRLASPSKEPTSTSTDESVLHEFNELEKGIESAAADELRKLGQWLQEKVPDDVTFKDLTKHSSVGFTETGLKNVQARAGEAVS